MASPPYNCSAALNPCFGFGACRSVAASDFRCFCDNSRTRFEADGTPSAVVSHPTCQFLDWEVDPDFVIYAGIPLGIANFVVLALALGAMYMTCKRKRMGANIQTLAISMLFLFGLTSTVSHLLDPYGARNMYPRPLDMVMVMLPHPCLATAYNLLLLLLRSLTGTGLAKTALTMRTLVIGVTVTNGILFGLLFLCATINSMQFYIVAYLLWITAFSVAFFIYTRRILKFLAGNAKGKVASRTTIVVRAQANKPVELASAGAGTGPGRPKLTSQQPSQDRQAGEERESEFEPDFDHEFDSTGGESIRSVTSAGFSPVPPSRNNLATKPFGPRSLALYVVPANQNMPKTIQLRQFQSQPQPQAPPQLHSQPQPQLQPQTHPQLQLQLQSQPHQEPQTPQPQTPQPQTPQPQPQTAAKPKVKRGRLFGSRTSRAQDKHSRLLARLGVSSAVICLCVVVVMVYWALTVDTANVRTTIINYYVAHWGANFWAGVVLWGFWPQKPAAKSRR